MTTHNQTVQSLQSLINGIEKNLPNGSFLLGGTTFTTPEVVDFLQSLIDALGTLQSAHSALDDAVSSYQAQSIKYAPLVKDLKLTLQIQSGDAASTLSDYGLTPRKTPAKMSPEILVARAQKAEATRKARNTMGSKQKLKVTGATAPAAEASVSPVTSNGSIAQATPPGAQTSVKPAS
jgi:hypothetical protein